VSVSVPAVPSVFASISSVFAPVADVFPPIATVFDAVSNSTVMARVDDVLAAIAAILAPVADIFPPVAAVLDPISSSAVRPCRGLSVDGPCEQDDRRGEVNYPTHKVPPLALGFDFMQGFDRPDAGDV
jgi:hypothetical protein